MLQSEDVDPRSETDNATAIVNTAAISEGSGKITSNIESENDVVRSLIEQAK